MQAGDRQISGSSQKHATGFSLVYFDIDRGLIREVVTEESSESVNDSNMFASTIATKTKSEITLIH